MKIEINVESKVLGMCHEYVDKKDFTLVEISITPSKWSSGNEEQILKLLSKILNVEYIEDNEFLLTLTVDGKTLDSFDAEFLLSLL